MSISKGSERVKAWIYVIINPWSEAMENENSLLGEGTQRSDGQATNSSISGPSSITLQAEARV